MELEVDYLSELKRECQEVFRIYEKLQRGETLNTLDKEWIEEIAKESGWNVDDVIDEIKNADKEPSSRIEKYQKMFKEYYNEAKELKEKKDYRQAGEKLWGAVTALIKIYAAKKGIPIKVWNHAKLFNFVVKNVSDKPVKLPDGSTISLSDAFYDLLLNAGALHVNFYEDNLCDEAFEKAFNRAVELIDKIKKVIDQM